MCWECCADVIVAHHSASEVAGGSMLWHAEMWRCFRLTVLFRNASRSWMALGWSWKLLKVFRQISHLPNHLRNRWVYPSKSEEQVRMIALIEGDHIASRNSASNSRTLSAAIVARNGWMTTFSKIFLSQHRGPRCQQSSSRR